MHALCLQVSLSRTSLPSPKMLSAACRGTGRTNPSSVGHFAVHNLIRSERREWRWQNCERQVCDALLCLRGRLGGGDADREEGACVEPHYGGHWQRKDNPQRQQQVRKQLSLAAVLFS